MVSCIGLERQTLVTVSQAYRRSQFMFSKPLWRVWKMRQQLATVLPGMFSGCIGVADVKEYQVVKYLDTVKERRSWSG